MSKKSQPQSGKERLALLQAEQARKSRQTKLLAILSGFVVLVLVVVGVSWAVASQNSKNADQEAKANAKSSAFIPKLAKIPESTFTKVGAGTVSNPPSKMSDPKAETKNGKPVITYVGAEYCPFCAMERWSMVIALNRFGHFEGLKPDVSTANDNPPSIPTMTFRDAKYTSKYLVFNSYETADREGKTLQQPPKSVTKTMQKDDPNGSIPYINFGGKLFSNGASYDGTSMSNKSSSWVMSQLDKPDSDIAKGVIGSANTISATICDLTGGKPTKVCQAPGVIAASGASSK